MSAAQQILPEILELAAEPCEASNVRPFPAIANSREVDRMARRIVSRKDTTIASYIRKRARWHYDANVPWSRAQRDLYDLETALIEEVRRLREGGGGHE